MKLTPGNLSPEQQTVLMSYLEQFVTPHKIDIFNTIIHNRTRYITVLLEDIFQSHNASAVMRTCDCFGLQDLYILEKKYNFSVTKEIALGSSKWLTLHKYEAAHDDPVIPFKKLKEKGYRLIATKPDENCTDIHDLNLEKGKIALMFGTERNGLSEMALEYADEFVKIPMVGFTESLNISVSVAVSTFHLTTLLRRSSIPWQLDENERSEVKLNWLINAINDSEKILELYLKKNPGFLKESL